MYENLNGIKVLITTEHFFYGPDGNQYRAVFGTITGANNGCLQIGYVVIKETEIISLILTGTVNLESVQEYESDAKNFNVYEVPPAIFNADDPNFKRKRIEAPNKNESGPEFLGFIDKDKKKDEK